MSTDNPAHRLRNILLRGMAEDKNMHCLDAWANVLGVPQQSHEQTLALLGRAMELPHEIVFLLKAHYPHQAESSGIWRNPIQAAIVGQNLGGRWETFINHIDQNCLSHLGLISDLLSHVTHTTVPDDGKIAELIERLTAAISDVEATEISKDLKVYLIRQLSKIVDALRYYRITGSEEILANAEAVVGRAHLDGRLLSFLKSHEVGQRVLDNLNALAALCQIYLGLPQLTTAFALLGK